MSTLWIKIRGIQSKSKTNVYSKEYTWTHIGVKTPKSSEAVLRLKLGLTSILLTSWGTCHFNLNFTNFLVWLCRCLQWHMLGFKLENCNLNFSLNFRIYNIQPIIQKLPVVSCLKTTQTDTSLNKDCLQKPLWKPVRVVENVSCYQHPCAHIILQQKVTIVFKLSPPSTLWNIYHNSFFLNYILNMSKIDVASQWTCANEISVKMMSVTTVHYKSYSQMVLISHMESVVFSAVNLMKNRISYISN